MWDVGCEETSLTARKLEGVVPRVHRFGRASFHSLRHSPLVTQLLPGGGIFFTVVAEDPQVGLIRAVSHARDGKQLRSLGTGGAESFAKGSIIHQQRRGVRKRAHVAGRDE